MKRTSMRKIKEIIKLSVTTNLSFRKIAGACNTSRPVVTKYLNAFNASGLSYEEIKEIDYDELYQLLFDSQQKKKNNNDRYALLSSKFEYLFYELKKRHVTLQKLWEEYIQENPDGYSRSQFCDNFNRWRKSSELEMHLNHQAGDKMFVDFTGKKLYLTDKETGKKRAVETFISILPASHCTFVCATETQKTEDWIKGSEEAFWYFGGTTKAIVPDCYRSAIKKYDCYDPDINPEYSRFADHYNIVILPARPAHPKDKALVENAVKIVYHWIYASLRNDSFYSLGELNRAILIELKKYNTKKMQLLKSSRFELFETVEKNSLNSLPLALYEHKKCSKATIQSNYHVLLSEDKRYYSVPFQYYKESFQSNKKKVKVEFYYTRDNIEIFFKDKRIAVHKRNYSNKLYTTNPDHMPERHRRYLERLNPEKTITLAKRNGPFVADFIDAIIKDHKHPEQSYKICRGIISLSKDYGINKLNTACRKALHLGFCSFKSIREMLKNNQEEMDLEPESFSQSLPEHSNIRGKNYFKNKLKELFNE